MPLRFRHFQMSNFYKISTIWMMLASPVSSRCSLTSFDHRWRLSLCLLRQSLWRNFSRQFFQEGKPSHGILTSGSLKSIHKLQLVQSLGTFPNLGGEQEISVSSLSPYQLLIVCLHVLCLLLHALFLTKLHIFIPFCPLPSSSSLSI